MSKFKLGKVVVTSGAAECLEENKANIFKFLERHQNCDWGDLCEEDRSTNNYALENQDRLFSSYKLQENVVIWIITESDRKVTTILLPSEY